jgi:TRAP-type transport system small permease protein
VLKKEVETMYRIEKYVLALMMIVTTVIVFFGVITRYIFGFSFSWIEEVPRYCLVWVTFLGAATLMREGINHPKITMLTDNLPQKWRLYVSLLSKIIILIITAIMGCGSVLMMWTMKDQVSPALEIPMYFIYCIIPLSSVMIIIRISYAIYHEFSIERTKT